MKSKNKIAVLLTAFLFVITIPILGQKHSIINDGTDIKNTIAPQSLSSDYDISFATYFGGSEDEQFKGVVTDSQDNIYFVGDTWSIDLPMVNSFDPTYNGGGWDGFLAKFSPDGSELLFSTYFGSPGGTQLWAITIDEQDNVWICGTCWGSGLPLVNPVDNTYGGGSDAFVAQFSPDGELLFSSYLGGSSNEHPMGIAAEAGIVYVTGGTYSQDFPVVNPLFPNSLGNGFWTKIDTIQNEISWSTRFDGTGDDIAIDSNGDLYLTGATRGPDFPATTSFAPPFDGRWHEDSFVLKTNANGNSIEYATRVGGNEPDHSNCIYLLADGSVVVAGSTSSNDMPVINPLKGTFGGEKDGFLYILDSTGSSLEYLTYFGGSSYDIIANLEIDSTGNFVITGSTFSQDFPLEQPLFDTLEVGTSDAFVSVLNPLTNELTFSTFFSGTTYGQAMTVDTDDNIIFGGNTDYYTQTLPVKNALYPYKNDKQDSFVCKLSRDFPPVTIIDLSGTLGNNDWFISDVLVTLTATDDISGIDYTEYSYDGTNWLLYSEPFIIPIEGEITIYYRSVDNAGNFETIKYQPVKIDQTSPVTTISHDGTIFLEDWYYPDVEITLTATDDHSGVAYTKYTKLRASTWGAGSGSWDTYTGPFNTVFDGMVYIILFRSTDIAGNTEVTKSVMIKVIRTPITMSDYLHIAISMLHPQFYDDIIPVEAENHYHRAIESLIQAMYRAESSMILEAFDHIKNSIDHLETAVEKGLDTYWTQEVINVIMFVLRYVVDEFLQETISNVGEENKFIIRAVDDYNIALQMIQMERYEEAVTFFKFSYRNIMKAKGEVINELFVNDLLDRLTEVQDLQTDEISIEALNYLTQAENKILLAIEKVNASLLAQSLIQLKDAVKNLLDVEQFGVDTTGIIQAILQNADDVTYLKILEAESILMGEYNRHIDKAWINYYKAIDLWNEGKFEFALSYYVKAIEKVNDALV